MPDLTTKTLPYRDLGTVFPLVADLPYACFLDSSLYHETQGRYSVICLHPVRICKGSREEVLAEVQSILKEHTDPEDLLPFPYLPGAVGFLSYDDGTALPEALFVFHDLYLVADQKDKTLTLLSCNLTEDSRARIRELEELLSSPLPQKELGADPLPFVYDSPFTERTYKEAVRDVVSHIKDGDIYVGNLTQQLTIPSSENPIDVYTRLREWNPAPYSAYLNGEGYEILCASPERFVTVQNGKVVTRPIKGTTPRSKDPATDEKNRNTLFHSAKDRAELLMITDLERNDLNRVCVPGSVQVPELYTVESYETVHHLVSTVTGQLTDDRDAVDLLRAAFPGGSITGAPKKRAVEILREIEKSPRGLYTGCIGCLSYGGDAEFNIVIRTAVHTEGTYTIGVGGGITYESDPQAEFDETLQKGTALFRAVFRNRQGVLMPKTEKTPQISADEGYAFGFGAFETIAVYNGTPILLEEHLRRLQEALQFFGIRRTDEELRRAVYVNLPQTGKKALKLTVSDENLLVSIRENPYGPDIREAGYTAALSEIRRNAASPFSGRKTLLNGELIWEKRRQHESGIDEPLFLNTDGLLTEGAVSNLFLVRDGVLLTPSADCGLLPGILRDWILKHFPVQETHLTTEDLRNSTEAFLTNSLMGVLPLNRIGEKEYTERSVGREIWNRYKEECKLPENA